MKLLAALVVWGCALLPAQAGREPLDHRPIADKVRMATHVVVGEMVTLQVIDEVTGKLVDHPKRDLDFGQQFELELKVTEVLYADKSRSLEAGTIVKVRFGLRSLSLEYFKSMFSNKQLVFYLSQDSERAGPKNYYYPFFGDPNLADSVEVRPELERLLEALSKLR